MLRYRPCTLELRHAFGVASNTRTATPAVLVEVERDGLTGHGEASLPPYLGETAGSVCGFLARVDLARFPDWTRLDEILPALDALAPGHTAAKAAVDLALHDWLGRRQGAPLHRFWGLDPAKAPPTSFTIGLDTPEVVRMKVREAAPYPLLKAKLGRDNDREMIEVIRAETGRPLVVDANQGWTDRDAAARMAEWLAARNVRLIEQPFPRDRPADTAWLRARSPLPLFADESVQRLADVSSAAGVFDGINIKLMKCTGLAEARRMIARARELGLKVMLGCMTETSCAVTAAAQLAPLADWADLDGALLIRNDPFEGMQVVDGRIVLPDRPGIGIVART